MPSDLGDTWEPQCLCPSPWFSVEPYWGYCPKHNPHAGNTAHTHTGVTLAQFWRLHPDDIEAIAKRVIELLRS